MKKFNESPRLYLQLSQIENLHADKNNGRNYPIRAKELAKLDIFNFSILSSRYPYIE